MPALTKGKVLVTGANGYIAVWVAKHLLDAGYSVRGTVRRVSTIPHLQHTFREYGDRFEVMVIPDMTKVCARRGMAHMPLYADHEMSSHRRVPLTKPSRVSTPSNTLRRLSITMLLLPSNTSAPQSLSRNPFSLVR